ncbi:MAG TPA: trigger factor [Stellaceae bacterium]|nr:trigger factor [Stellaceae bacterium]
MQVTETSAEGLKHEFTVTVAAEDIERQVAERLAELGRSARIAGFRPGKVPLTLLRQRYGRSVMGEVLERAVSDSSAEAMRERNLRPALQPKIDIVSFNEGTNLEYKMAVEVLPEIEPVNVAEVKLERLKPEVPDDEVDKALERIARQQRKSDVVDRPADKGDVVVLDFAGTLDDGTPVPGGSASDYSLELGTGSFIPGFEDQLVGVTAGAQRSLAVTFPADYGSTELAGKAANFAVTVKAVRGVAPQPIDDSLATAVGMESLDDLRQAVRERLALDYGRMARQKLKQDLLDRLAERYHFAVPEGMVELEFNMLWRQVEEERKREAQAGAAATGALPEAAAEAAAEDAPAPAGEPGDDVLKAEYRKIAERRVRLGLVLAEFGRAHSITVTQEELNRALLEQARRYPGQERQVIEYYRQNPAMIDSIRAPVYEDKVIDALIAAADVSDRPVAPAELFAATRDTDDAAGPDHAQDENPSA